MENIKIGLVGLGHRGLGWLRNLQRIQGYQITALCDPITALHQRALDAVESPDSVQTYARYEDLLANAEVDAVALCVRCREQGALAAMALEAGKHVNSEVPAAHTLEDCWRIVAAVENSGCIYQLAEQVRHWGVFDAWRGLVAAGRLGRVTFCEGQYIGYYGTRQFFQDPDGGQFYAVEDLDDHPEAQPTWLHQMPPIHYLPHELSPMLKVIDDRVVQVVGMSTATPSYSHPQIGQPDIQVALMKTAKDALLRLATGFTQPVSHERGHHWYQIMGTNGSVEWKRSGRGKPLMWLADEQMHDMAEVDWDSRRTNAHQLAHGSGHGDADYYVHASFRDAVLGVEALEFDVYQAMDTAAPAILAADSIDADSQPRAVPDFRPGPHRAAGQIPGAAS
jgi:predicted dehydrogenase